MKLSFVYFKSTGKWYASGEPEIAPQDYTDCIYPRDFGREVLRRKQLPGLQSGTWFGPFTVQPEGSYTERILQG